MPPPLHTPRLILAPATPADLDALHRIWDAAEVRRYLFDDEPVPRQRADAILHDCLALADELGLWCVRLTGADGVLGCVGLLPAGAAVAYDPHLAGAVEPLAAFAPAVWGRGFATEALARALRYGFDELGLPWVAAVNDIPNAASDRLVRRLGFEVTGECDGPRHRLRIYRLGQGGFAGRVRGVLT